MKELKFTRCFINGKKSGIASYDNNENRILFFSESLGAGVGVDSLRAAGVSLHQFNNSIVIPSADSAGILSVIPGAVIEWENSKEYNERVAAAVGSRSGKNNTPESETENKPGKSETVPAVVPVDAFQAPAVSDCSVLFDMVKNMAPVVDSLNTWAVDASAALLSGAPAVAAPACVAQLSAFLPSVADAFKAYQAVIIKAVEDYREKMAAIEAERKAKEAAAKAAAAAAANGKNLVTLSDGSTVEVTGKVHPAFAEVLEDLRDFRAVYLYGPAGTGKSFMARQLADALGVPFESSGKSDLKYDLIGTYNADGKHIYTAFTRAWCNGGVWLWDEWDRSSPDSCTAINDALANGKIDIPGLGMVEKNPNFYCLAAGNTCGFGPSAKYSAAQNQDFAALTRFLSKIKIDYCRDMDMIVTGGDSDFCDFVAAVRGAISATGIDIDLPIRALRPMLNKSKRSGMVRALECCLFAGVGATQVRQISARVNGSGAWFDALREYAGKVA